MHVPPSCPFLPFDESHLEVSDRFFMQCAYNEALRAWQLGEIPIGAVAVIDGKIAARSCNLVETRKDATAHAEMEIIRQLSAQKQDWRLNDVKLYVTKEPCPMCSGALYKARVKSVVIGLPDNMQGCLGGRLDFKDLRMYHKIDVSYEPLGNACDTLLRTFFLLRRQMYNDKRENLC